MTSTSKASRSRVVLLGQAGRRPCAASRASQPLLRLRGAAPRPRRGSSASRRRGRSAAGSACACAPGRRSASRSRRCCERVRQVGEQRLHLLARLEVVLGREPAPVLVGDEPALGDGEQRVVRLVVGGLGEERLVRRDERQAVAVGEVDELGLDGALVLQRRGAGSRRRAGRRRRLQDLEARLREVRLRRRAARRCRGGRRARP